MRHLGALALAVLVVLGALIVIAISAPSMSVHMAAPATRPHATAYDGWTIQDRYTISQPGKPPWIATGTYQIGGGGIPLRYRLIITTAGGGPILRSWSVDTRQGMTIWNPKTGAIFSPTSPGGLTIMGDAAMLPVRINPALRHVLLQGHWATPARFVFVLSPTRQQVYLVGPSGLLIQTYITDRGRVIWRAVTRSWRRVAAKPAAFYDLTGRKGT